MPADQIARNLAFVNWTVLAGLAVGAFGAVVFLRFRTDATKGFLGFTALAAAGSPVLVDPAWELPRRALLGAFGPTALATSVVLLRGGRAGRIGPLALALGMGALFAGALTWGGGAVGALVLAGQLLVLAAATGGAFAAMILGHWYLVTPKLSTGPALVLSRLLLAVIAAQVALFGLSVLLGAGRGLPPLAPLTGEWALFVWLRLAVGLVLPLVVTFAAVRTVRIRAMESATGLLYIDVGAIASGTILAAGLFGAGLLV